ncbi:MAG: DUF1826 domain-containing protein [Pseudomonadota bacterium]
MSVLEADIPPADGMSDAVAGVRVVTSANGMAHIRQPDCAAVVWQREPLTSFQAWINALDPSHLPRTRIVLRPAAVRDAVIHACDQAQMPESPQRTILADDISALAAAFADLTQAAFVRLRLDVVNTDACRKFHVDAISSRLICTYRGTGTQYGVARDGEQPDRVFTAPVGAPLVLRGKLWPAKQPSRLLHRSPPIAGTGETRLVLVVDPLDDATEDVDYVMH